MSAQHFCRRCKYYDPYYTCELRHFKKTQFGWCSQKRKIVPSREGCGAYATRAPQCYGEDRDDHTQQGAGIKQERLRREPRALLYISPSFRRLYS